MSRERVELLREIIKASHESLEATMADVTAEDAHWRPSGLVNPIGAQYAHVVTTEDFMVNVAIAGLQPLMATAYADRAGMSEPPPAGGDWHEWSSRVQVDLGLLRPYAKAVYAATDTYLDSVSDDELKRQIDMAKFGMGRLPVGTLLEMAAVANPNMHCGEISAVKGLQGKPGYPW